MAINNFKRLIAPSPLHLLLPCENDGKMAREHDVPVHDDTIDEDDAASDYGSDLDSATLDEVFSQSFSQPVPTAPTIKIEDVDEPLLPQQDDAEAQTHSLRLARLRQDLDAAIESNGYTSTQLARIRESLNEAIDGIASTSPQLSPRSLKRERPLEIEYDESNRNSFSRGYSPSTAGFERLTR